jgi:response regulator of citrate/malate metabolism
MCSTKKKVEQKKRLDEILIGLGISREIYELIKNGCRRRDLTIHKINYLKEAMQLNYTQEEMGRNIGISESAVRNMISRNK